MQQFVGNKTSHLPAAALCTNILNTLKWQQLFFIIKLYSLFTTTPYQPGAHRSSYNGFTYLIKRNIKHFTKNV